MADETLCMLASAIVRIVVFCAFGRKRRVEEIVNGENVERKNLDLKINLDERICDG